MHGLKHRVLATTGVLLTTAALTFVSTADAAAGCLTGRPGDPGVGDYLYPNLGNGGYDAREYFLKQTYPTAGPTQQVHGTLRMNAAATHNLSAFNLDFAGDAIDSVKVNGHTTQFTWLQEQEELVIAPSHAIRRGHGFDVEITYRSHATRPAADDTYPVGFVATEHGSFTSFQPDTAHTVIPVNDHPSDKARWRFELDVPRGVTAVANGVATGRRTVGDRTVWSYEENTPMATELMQLAVGTDLRIVKRHSVGDVAYRDVIAQGRQDVLEPGFAVGPDKLQWAINQIGRFPHPVYGNLGVDQLMGYALETQGLSLHSYALFDPNFLPGRTGQEWFYGSVMVHEIAHEWYGNVVSPKQWSDLWLNEGWATWFMKHWEEDTGAIDEWGNPTIEDYMREQYSQGDIWRAQFGPVAKPASADVLFSPNVYDGGAVVLYALEQKVGEQTMDTIQREWPQRFRNKSVSTDDFIAFVSDVAGQDLTEFLSAWVYGTSTPTMPGHPDWKVEPVTAETAAAHAADTGSPEAHAFRHGHAHVGA